MTTLGFRRTGPAAVDSVMAASRIVTAFRLGVEVAEAVAGATAPNPPVGCVVLDAQGVVLACEPHTKAGSPHAEAAAIAACRRAGNAERIHTVVVTLEPCNHHGRTPPCVDAILATSAQAVWIAARDPNPKVAGGGAASLSSHGLIVRFLDQLDHPKAPSLARAAKRLIAPFAKWTQSGRPWVTLKQAIAADGGMIPLAGHKTFTSPASLALAHRLRRRSDAIVTGSGCILVDAPAFTVRHVPDHAGKRRVLVILDRRDRTPVSYVKAAEARGFDVRIRSRLKDALDELGDAGVQEALVEAGPTLLRAVMDQDLWDEHVIIRQSPEAGAPDTVDVVSRQAA